MSDTFFAALSEVLIGTKEFLVRMGRSDFFLIGISFFVGVSPREKEVLWKPFETCADSVTTVPDAFEVQGLA